MKTGRLLNIFLVVFVDMLGFGLILPLVPYYAETFGASPLVIGLIIAAFAAGSLVGAPLMGRLSDRYGRRPILLLSVAGSLIGYLLLGFAHPLGTLLAHLLGSHLENVFVLSILFTSRLVDGFTGGNLTVAQAYISDNTDERNRTLGLGLVGSAFGLGFIIGPLAGGVLSQWGYNIPAFAAAGITLVNIISIYFFLPESLTREVRAARQHVKQPVFSAKTLLAALNRPKVGPLLLVRFFLMLALAMFQSVFALFAQHRLNLSTESTGFVLAYVGFYSVLVQGVGIGLLTRRFTDHSIIMTALGMMFLGLVGWSFTPNLPVMLVVLLPLFGGAWIVNTTVTSGITKLVAPDELGGMLGISNTLESITRVISPAIGGLLFGSIGMWAPGVFSAIMILWAGWLAYRQVLSAEGAEVDLTAEESCA